MNDDRLQFLIRTAADRGLTADEEAELAQLLENPECRDRLEREFALQRPFLRLAFDYRDAKLSDGPKIPPRKLDMLLKTVEDREPSVKSHTTGRPARFRFGLAIAAVAAAAVLLLSVQRYRPSVQGNAPLVVEYGVVASQDATRATEVGARSDLGSSLRIMQQPNLAAIRAWTESEFPKTVRARVWVDEEAGLLRAITRGPRGERVSVQVPLQASIPLADQLRRFADDLNKQ